jgi:hypothetical protein
VTFLRDIVGGFLSQSFGTQYTATHIQEQAQGLDIEDKLDNWNKSYQQNVPQMADDSAFWAYDRF